MVPEGSGGFQKDLVSSGKLWRVLAGSEGYWSGLDITGYSWVNLEVSGHLVGMSRQF